MLKQAFIQVRKVSVRMSRRGDALVHLHHIYVLPGNIFVCEGTQHLPRSVAATDGDDKTAARIHCRASLRSYELSSLSRYCIGIGEYFNLHRIS
jgi:hypothetical protein